MSRTDYLIIGGGITGTTAAETIRARDAEGTITVVSAEPYPLYSRLRLSKPQTYLGAHRPEDLFLKTPEWYVRHAIALLAGATAIAHDAHQRSISLANRETLKYERMLVALGTTPRPFLPDGAREGDVLQLQTADDAFAFKRVLEQPKAKILIVGGGFVAFEAAWIAHRFGAGVTVVSSGPWPFAGRMDAAAGSRLREAMQAAGVRYVPDAKIASVHHGVAALTSGETVPFHRIVSGIGVATPSEWLTHADRAENGSVEVNEYLETNLADVWAAGDCAVLRAGAHRSGNWEDARRMGLVAGRNMTGAREPFLLGAVYETEGFGLTIRFTPDAPPDILTS
jgi:3-phenylpropionate/trans-cinnamate dioxygenase ferredoxin reductase subunit